MEILFALKYTFGIYVMASSAVLATQAYLVTENVNFGIKSYQHLFFCLHSKFRFIGRSVYWFLKLVNCDIHVFALIQ